MLQHLLCSEVESFDSDVNNAFIEAEKQNAPLFVLAFGERKGEPNNVSWCPDCEQAMPLIIEALQTSLQNSVLLEVTVKREK